MPTPHPLAQFVLAHRAPAALPAAALAVAKEMLVNAAAGGLAGAAPAGGFAGSRRVIGRQSSRRFLAVGAYSSFNPFRGRG